jgi:UrcA family protein
MNRLWLSALALLASGLGGVQAAQLGSDATVRATIDGRLAVTVHYGDLNLANRDGTNALYARIVRAAERVCPHADQRLGAKLATQRCVQGAVDAAVHLVNHSALTQLHAGRTAPATLSVRS